MKEFFLLLAACLGGSFVAMIIGQIAFGFKRDDHYFLFVPRLPSQGSPGTSFPKKSGARALSKFQCDLHGGDCKATRIVFVNKTDYEVCEDADLEEIEKLHDEEMKIWAQHN